MSALVMPTAGTKFALPPEREAARPPEARGLARDEVRLLVAETGGISHRTFRELPELLHPGDLLVVNLSATLPAAVDITRRGLGATVHVSTQLDDGHWVIEVRRSDAKGPVDDLSVGEVLRLPGAQRLRVVAPHPEGQTRLWRTAPMPVGSTVEYLARHGRPIRYPYVSGEWPLSAVQSVFASEPGSAEMPSAGRPFTEGLLVDLITRGVAVAPLVLHTGVSSQDANEPPQPEPFTVPAATARLVNSTRAAGRRVVAVGTTVVRALETAADRSGDVHATTGWTSLVLGPDRPARTVTGLVTGLHAPEASHLLLLEAVVGARLVSAAYDAATGIDDGRGYLWHEFGDSSLFLPFFTPRGWSPGSRFRESL